MPSKNLKRSTSANRKSRLPHEDDVLMTVKDVAERDQCCEKTVRRAIDAGILPVVRIGANGRLIRIRKSDHAAYRSAFAY